MRSTIAWPKSAPTLIGGWLPKIAGGSAKATPQKADGVTYADKIDRGETRIVWQETAGRVVRRINAFAPVPGAWTEWAGARIKVLAARSCDGVGEPGVALTDGLVIACGDGAVEVTRLQVAGRQAMDAKAFLTGHAVPTGTRFV